MSSKPLILLYEGIQGSGKSTLAKKVQLITGYKSLTIDRFTPSIWVYGTYRNEKIADSNYFAELTLESNFDVRVIWCKCPIELAYKRCIEKGKIRETINGLYRIDCLFNEYFNSITSFTNVIQIDTQSSLNFSVKYVVDEIFS